VKIEKVVAVHDVGQAINNDAIKGNIEGGVLQGLGHTLYEALEWDSEGHMMNPNMADYKVPTSKEAGYELDIHLVEEPHPEGPYGAKGIGEICLCGVAAAVSNAILDATGVRMTKIPIKPDDVYLALKRAGKTTVGGVK
jgi:carbon-monoxide dehydrogenase large subunit